MCGSLMKSGVGVEKVGDGNVFSAAAIAGSVLFFSLQLRDGFHRGYCRLAEEADQSLEVLGSRCQEELLPHELQSPQTQATQSDLILEFREQRFHLLSFPLCLGELWRVRQLPCSLSGWLIHVDGKIAKRPARALGF